MGRRSELGEIGRLKEAVNMVFDLQYQGLSLTTQVLNRALWIASETNSVEYAEELFDEMCQRRVSFNSSTYRSMVVAYCRVGRISEAERWLSGMIEKGFVR